MEIKMLGATPSRKAGADYFTGTVWQDPIIDAPEPASLRAVWVRFEPGARTAWHTHPLGQALLVPFGPGRVQREGGPVEEIRPGDIVFFEPGEKHWHGAAPDRGMSHVAIHEVQDGQDGLDASIASRKARKFGLPQSLERTPSTQVFSKPA